MKNGLPKATKARNQQNDAEQHFEVIALLVSGGGAPERETEESETEEPADQGACVVAQHFNRQRSRSARRGKEEFESSCFAEGDFEGQ